MKDDKVTDAMLEQGFAQLKEGLFEDALDTFTACHLVEAADDRPFRGRGLAYTQLGKPAAAEAEFMAARRLNEADAENWMGLAISLAMQNKIYEALGAYETLIANQPDFVLAYIQIARLQFKVGAISNGRDWLTKALAHRPNLEQRRLIESLMKDQDKLDANRYYRPDFERLRKANGGGMSLIQSILARFKKKEIESTRS